MKTAEFNQYMSLLIKQAIEMFRVGICPYFSTYRSPL